MRVPDDIWFRWLLRTRFGGDEEHAGRGLAMLRSVRDLVLDKASLHPGDVALDVGLATASSASAPWSESGRKAA
jgi:precorrin-6B methylase 2